MKFLSSRLLLLFVGFSFSNAQRLRRHLQQQQNATRSHQGIIGGANADASQYPFFALLFETNCDDTSFECGGTLFAANKVLTAAHCFGQGTTYDFVRIGGSNNCDGETIAVKGYVLHPNYDEAATTTSYDIAVIELERDATSTTSYVTLNQDSTLGTSTSGTSLVLIGHGQTDASDSGSASNTLKTVDLLSVDTTTCQTEFNGVTANLHVCADDATQGSCNGDSGGPLLFNTNTQVGVNSFSNNPCGSGGYDVFSSVASSYDWITTTSVPASASIRSRVFSWMRRTIFGGQ